MSNSRHIGTLIVVILKAVCVCPLCPHGSLLMVTLPINYSRKSPDSLAPRCAPLPLVSPIQRNLPNKRHIGKQDPYCQVIFNGEKRRTKAIKRGGQHPEWDEEFRFELYEDVDELPHVPGADTPPPPPPKSNGKGPPKVKGGNFLAISCYADDPREPDLIGESKVDLTEVLTKGETDGASCSGLSSS